MCRLCRILLLFVIITQAAVAQSLHPQLLDAGSSTTLPRVLANDNRSPAGTQAGNTLDVQLDVVWADWRVETPEGPGLRVVALAEAGKAPTVPAPLLRVETGTHIRARLRNTLRDSTITVFGLQRRPAEQADSLVVPPGEARTVTFEAGEPGTYFYWVRLGTGTPFKEAEEEQLAGAFIIDPPGGSAPDRIFVINIFHTTTDPAHEEWLEALTINGLSWPFTERLRPSVGDTLRWRVINASRRNHPMHLHGFFYAVTARGTLLEDTIYETEDRRLVVTETMRGRSTMAMEWIPTRPGTWVFHCHLSFHVAPFIRLPGAAEATHELGHVHMAGLVLGIEVEPGPSDLISYGEPRHLTLYAREYTADSLSRYRFSLDSDALPDPEHRATPSPALILKQYQTTYVTVKNQMSFPTGVHWHGLELDSWSDGVPGYSASDGKVSPVIPPGGAFTYKLSSMRPGTFIYHTHLNDIEQLSGGLYGPMLVFAEDDAYDPETDHVYMVGWKTPNPKSLADFEINGRSEQPVQHAVVGETHRIRVINIAPAGNITARMLRQDAPVPLKMIAKDGADLPKHQQVDLEVSPRLFVGETADFAFTPTEPGAYELVVGYRRASWRQRWEVVAAPEPH